MIFRSKPVTHFHRPEIALHLKKRVRNHEKKVANTNFSLHSCCLLLWRSSPCPGWQSFYCGVNRIESGFKIDCVLDLAPLVSQVNVKRPSWCFNWTSVRVLIAAGVFWISSVLKSIRVESPLTAVDFTLDGTGLVVGSTQGKIYQYDLRNSSTPTRITVAHKTSVTCLRFQSNLKQKVPSDVIHIVWVC